jgi:hypothetical protein
VAAEIDPNSSPSRYNPSDYGGPAVPDHGLRRVWERIPTGLRLVIPITLLLAVVVVSFYAWMKPSRDDWSQLPTRLVCQVQSGLSPPPPITVASVDVTHARGNVLQLMIRFAQPLPASPSYALTYSLANNGTPFAVLNPQQGTDDLIIRKAEKANAAAVRTDKATHAGRTAPDAVEISLDLTRFGIDKGLVSPGLTVSSQLNTPAAASVGYAMQICHG